MQDLDAALGIVIFKGIVTMRRDGDDLYPQLLCPVCPSIAEPAPRISVKEGILKGIPYGGRNLSLTGEDTSDPHDHFNVLDSRRTAKGAGAAGGARPEFGTLKDLGEIGIKVSFSD